MTETKNKLNLQEDSESNFDVLGNIGFSDGDSFTFWEDQRNDNGLDLATREHIRKIAEVVDAKTYNDKKRGT